MKVSQGNQKWCYSISYTLLSIADLLTETMAGIGYYYCCCFLYGLQNCTKFARLITRRVIGTHTTPNENPYLCLSSIVSVFISSRFQTNK